MPTDVRGVKREKAVGGGTNLKIMQERSRAAQCRDAWNKLGRTLLRKERVVADDDDDIVAGASQCGGKGLYTSLYIKYYLFSGNH